MRLQFAPLSTGSLAGVGDLTNRPSIQHDYPSEETGCRRSVLLKSDYKIAFNDMPFSQETEIQYYVWYCNDAHIFPQILCATVTIKF
jgi:hypothetical protein